MNNVIEVKPDKNGKLFITLFGTTYEIKVIEEKQDKVVNKPKKEKK